MTDETSPPESETEGGSTATEQAPGATAEGEEKKPAKLHQAVELSDVGPCKKHIKVTVERPDIDQRFNEKFSELVADANVAGFRPGKAPRKVVERRYHKEVAEQVKAEVLLQSLEQLAEEHQIAPLSAPDIDPGKIEIPKDGPLVYEFNVEVRPEFDLPDYKGLNLRRPIKKFTDADVEQEERRLLAPYGQLVPKEDDTAAVIGDFLICDVTTRADGRVISELKEMQVRLDNRLAFKDGVAERFGEVMKGAKPGQSREVDIVLSESVADPALRAKTVQATFAVKDIKMLRLPELTHELMHEFGVHTAEQLRELIRVVLDRRLEYLQRQSARQQVMSQITAASTWELPQDLLMRQARTALGRRVMEMRSSGIPEEEIKARQRLLQQDALRSTELALKEHFVLQKVAEVEKIDVNEDDIDAEIERIAAQDDESPRRVRARIEKEDLMDALAADILERKALDLILQNAEYQDVPLGKEEEREGAVATVEEQAVPGKMHDPTTPPPSADQPAPGPLPDEE
jgi:trigger factor